MSYLSDTLGDAYKEGMTEDEISAALENATNKSLDHLKSQLSKVNSEAAEYKRQLRAKQTEEEQKAAEARELQEKILAENEELKRNARISGLKASFSAFGTNGETADKIISGLMDGAAEDVVTLIGGLLKEEKSKWESDAMRKMGRPTGGNSGTATADYDAQIAKAQANGDVATVAYLTRLKQTTLED